jgi:hypothetical protein
MDGHAICGSRDSGLENGELNGTASTKSSTTSRKLIPALSERVSVKYSYKTPQQQSRALMGAQELACSFSGFRSRPAFSGVYVLPHCKGQATHPEGHIQPVVPAVCGPWPQHLSISSLLSQHLWTSVREGSGVYAPCTTAHILIALRRGDFRLAARVHFPKLQEGVSIRGHCRRMVCKEIDPGQRDYNC